MTLPSNPSTPSAPPVEEAWPLSALVPRTAVRAIGLLVLDLAFTALAARSALGDDALGVGLTALLLYPAVALTWGAVDGWRYRHRFGLVGVSWLVAAPLAALGMQAVRAVQTRAADPTYDVAQVLADLADGVPFFTGLLLVPALLATGCVAALTRSVR